MFVNSVYILDWELSHLGDDKFDAELVRFSGWENTFGLFEIQEYLCLPRNIFFEANFQTIQDIDFPWNNVRWTIMSKRMFNLLFPNGSSYCETISITMIDDRTFSKDRYNKNGIALPNVENHDFVAVKFTMYTDALDKEMSMLEIDKESSLILNIEYLVLKKTNKKFPTLFRLREYPALLLISSFGRTVLENANIKGICFHDLPDIRFL